MTTISHKSLTGDQIHEPKGADAAAANKIYVADGAGSGAWGLLTADSLTGTGNSFGAQLLYVEEQKSGGIGAGSSAANTWNLRALSSAITNEIAGASLASSKITLPAGTYFAIIRAPGFQVGPHRVRLYNDTDSVNILVGSTALASGSDFSMTDSWAIGRFTLSASKTVAVHTHTVGAVRSEEH